MAKRRWINWAGNRKVRCEVVTPKSLGELQEAVRRSVRERRRIRAAGRGYSWSKLVPSTVDDTIISMKALKRVLRLEDPRRDGGLEPGGQAGASEAVDASFARGRERPPITVEVECGISIGKLGRYLRRKNLTLASPTLFPKPTVGGVVATGSHGTGRWWGNFADQVREMKIVNYQGRVICVKEEPQLHAARVALGSLGIIYSVTLEVLPQFHVHVDKRPVPVKYVLEEFDDLMQSVEFLEIFWFPLRPKMWLYAMNRTRSRPIDSRWRLAVERLGSAIQAWLGNVAGDRFVPWVARYVPRLTPLLSRFAEKLSNRMGETVKTASEAFHFVRTYPKNWDLSYAIPADRAAFAWREAIELVEEYARAERYPVNLALHCRFTGASKSWLAPNYGRETCWIEVATARGTPDWDRFFDEMEKRWSAIPGARPHWGKLHGRCDQLRGRYPVMRRFLELREDWDPRRVFLNRFLEDEVFQLRGRARRLHAAPEAPPDAAPDLPLGGPDR